VLAKRLSLLIPVLFLLAFSAKADDIATVYFNGGYAFGDNGYGIPPYQGTLNGEDALFYCVDFTHDITGNTSWQATVTDISSTADYSATRLGSGTIYSEIAWLLDQSVASGNRPRRRSCNGRSGVFPVAETPMAPTVYSWARRKMPWRTASRPITGIS